MAEEPIKDDRIAPQASGQSATTMGKPAHKNTDGEAGGERMTAGPVSAARAAKRGPLSVAQKVGVGIVAALSVTLVVISGLFLTPSFMDALMGDDDLFQTTAEVGEQETSENQVAQDVADESTQKSAEVDPQDASDADDRASDRDAAQGTGDATQDGDVGSQGGSAASGALAASSGDADLTGDSAQQQPATVTVSVSVSSSVVNNPVSGGANPTFSAGATAYDALCATGLSVNAQSTSMGVYVIAVGGLAQGQHGGQSGWKYSVNGVDGSYSAGSYVLQDGDVVAWRYVLTQNG